MYLIKIEVRVVFKEAKRNALSLRRLAVGELSFVTFCTRFRFCKAINTKMQNITF
jgi:hypothetical protein